MDQLIDEEDVGGVPVNQSAAKRDACIAALTHFVSERHGKDIHEFVGLNDNHVIEDVLINYFASIKVSNSERPSKNYVLAIKSHLKSHLKMVGNIDIGNVIIFNRFNTLIREWHKDLLDNQIEHYAKKKKHLSSPHVQKLTRDSRIKRVRCISGFSLFLKSRFGRDLASLLEDKDIAGLEEGLIQYFACMRVKNSDERPSKSYCETFKSNLRVHIKSVTGNTDIICPETFPRFNQFLKGFYNELKAVGKGDVAHHAILSNENLLKIGEFCDKVVKLFEARCTAQYDEALKEIPFEYKDKYQVVLQMAAQFVIHFFDYKKTLREIIELRRDAYELVQEEGGSYFYKSVATFEEDSSMCGLIPFETIEWGFNPGRVLQIYLGCLHPECPAMFQKPRLSKFFIHDSREKIMFEKSKTGKNMVANSFGQLCQILGLPHMTSQSVRATRTHQITLMSGENDGGQSDFSRSYLKRLKKRLKDQEAASSMSKRFKVVKEASEEDHQEIQENDFDNFDTEFITEGAESEDGSSSFLTVDPFEVEESPSSSQVLEEEIQEEEPKPPKMESAPAIKSEPITDGQQLSNTFLGRDFLERLGLVELTVNEEWCQVLKKNFDYFDEEGFPHQAASFLFNKINGTFVFRVFGRTIEKGTRKGKCSVAKMCHKLQGDILDCFEDKIPCIGVPQTGSGHEGHQSVDLNGRAFSNNCLGYFEPVESQWNQSYGTCQNCNTTYCEVVDSSTSDHRDFVMVKQEMKR